jgi:hypothetical protein
MFFNEQSMWFFHIFYLWNVHSSIGVYGTCGVFSKSIRMSKNPMAMGRRSEERPKKDGKCLQLFMSHLVNVGNKLETQHDSNYIRD